MKWKLDPVDDAGGLFCTFDDACPARNARAIIPDTVKTGDFWLGGDALCPEHMRFIDQYVGSD